MPLDGEQDLFIQVSKQFPVDAVGILPSQQNRQQAPATGAAVATSSQGIASTEMLPGPISNVVVPTPTDHVSRRTKKSSTLRPSTQPEESEYDTKAPASRPAPIASTPNIPAARSSASSAAKQDSSPSPPAPKRARPSIRVASQPSSITTACKIPSTAKTAIPPPTLSPLERSIPTITHHFHSPPASTTTVGTQTSIKTTKTTKSTHSATSSSNRISISTQFLPSTPCQEPHHFEVCPHTSPPRNRPLNAQPYLTQNPVYNPLHPASSRLPQFIVKIPTPCYVCDTAARRALEDDILSAYSRAIHPKREALSGMRLKLASGAAAQGEIELLRSEIESLQEAENREVQRVWRGYSARWGPGTIGVDRSAMGGRMRVSWIRPERETQDAEEERRRLGRRRWEVAE